MAVWDYNAVSMVSWILILNSKIWTTYGDNIIQSSMDGNSLHEPEDMKTDQRFLKYSSYSQVWRDFNGTIIYGNTITF